MCPPCRNLIHSTSWEGITHNIPLTQRCTQVPQSNDCVISTRQQSELRVKLNVENTRSMSVVLTESTNLLYPTQTSTDNRPCRTPHWDTPSTLGTWRVFSFRNKQNKFYMAAWPLCHPINRVKSVKTLIDTNGSHIWSLHFMSVRCGCRPQLVQSG